MRWIFAVALLVGGAYLLASGHPILGTIAIIVGILTVIRCIIGAAFKAIWKLIRKPLAIILAIVLIILSITSIPILVGPKTQPAANCDYLILLGAGVNGDTPSPILQDRINTAYTYLTEHPNTICIATGGKGDGENISEAQCIFNQLTAMGISADRIWIEDQATSTVENFKYSLEMLEGTTGSVGVVSNEFHLFRASLIAKKQGLKPIFIAAPTSKTGTRISYTIRETIVLWKFLLTGG